MQKTFVTIFLLGSAIAGFAQGTVFFSNGGLNKLYSGFPGSNPSTWMVVPTTARSINYGLFYGIGPSQPAALTFIGVEGVNSTSTAGVIASPNDGVSPVTAVGISGTAPGETDVWIQIAGWSASFGTHWAAAQTASWTIGGSYFGRTSIINVAPTAGGLGPVTGPGAVIWQTAAGTDPHKFPGGSLLMFQIIPEPSTMALLGLGVAALLIFRRGK